MTKTPRLTTLIAMAPQRLARRINAPDRGLLLCRLKHHDRGLSAVCTEIKNSKKWHQTFEAIEGSLGLPEQPDGVCCSARPTSA